jgi:hypothetical protein
MMAALLLGSAVNQLPDLPKKSVNARRRSMQ